MTDDTTPIEQPLDSERLNIPYFFTLERYDQCRALESLIFASEEPLTTRVMHRILVLEDPTNEHPGQQPLPLDGEPAEADTAAPLPVFEIPKGYFDELVDDINTDLERTDRPFRIVKIAGGYQFATTPQHGSLVQRLLKARNRKRLTQAALETLAIIAYRQPITKGEVDAIRGVNAGEVVNSLAEKGLVAMVGRSEQLGKPLLYGTTEEFLRLFGLGSLSDLPKLREIDDLLKTTTTLVELDETISITTDHRTLRRQLALLLDADRPEEPENPETTEATSGAYFEPQSDEPQSDEPQSDEPQSDEPQP
ncbi:MAG: SMC-Scp complex subunit ScpB [Candidatus Kapaibacteriota bacterium]